MTVLSVDGLTKAYGTDTVFADVSFKVGNSDRVGIVGTNGAGKTTLLRLVSGEEESDSGVIASDKTVPIAYMHQNADYTSEKTAVEEVEEIFSDVVDVGKKLDDINLLLETSSDPALIARQCVLNDKYIDMGGLTYKSRIESALCGLGLSRDEIRLPVCRLSGGQRTCVLLARLLLSGAGLIMLDEPTNHLDIKATEWLEDFLVSYSGAVMVVSHDRFFLDRVCNRIFETENHKLTVYNGNYTFYKEKKEADRIAIEREYEKNTEEIKRIESIIEQQRRFGQERNFITIKSKQHQIDRIKAELVVPDKDPAEISFHFSASGKPGNEILIAKGLTAQFGDTVLFKNAELYIRKGEKVFLAGANGCGKTTLLKMIVSGNYTNGGSVTLGAGVKLGYYEQTGASLDPKKTVFQTISDAYPRMNNTDIRCALGTFLFRGDNVFKTVEELSGGERARVELALLMMSDTNFLIMDEPTNHLDIESKEVLERALQDYDGTLLAVSHDRYFVNALANRIYVIDDRAVTRHDGNYDSLLSSIRAFHEPDDVEKHSAGLDAYSRKKQAEANDRRQKRRLEKLEEDIDVCERGIEDIKAQMCDPAIAADYARLTELSAQLSEKEKCLDTLYSEWEKISAT